MKNSFLFLGALIGIAQMQALSQTLEVPVPTPGVPTPASSAPTVAPLVPSLEVPLPARLSLTETFKIDVVKDKPGLFHLTASKAAPEQVLVSLVTMAGGKATFNNRVADPSVGNNRSVMRMPVPRTLSISAVCTVRNLIIRSAVASGLSVRVGNDEYEFSPGRRLVAIPSLPPQKPDSEMNLNRSPGKNLPKDAKPFDFNDKRFYHVSIRQQPSNL